MEFGQKTCSANNVQEKWSNIKEKMFLIRHNPKGYKNCPHKIPMGGSYVGISSNRNRGVSIAFKNFGSKNKICSWKLSMQDLALGGLLMIVQIDESVLSRAMHNRGRDLLRPQHWVVGMYDVAAKACFCGIYNTYRSFHLLHGLAFHLSLGLSNLPVDPPYIHKTVNHSLFFRASVKKSFKRGGPKRESLLPSKIDIQCLKNRKMEKYGGSGMAKRQKKRSKTSSIK
ncbi:hypothetical protein RF11_14768 [Thelohanellus kitauei]|uniref:Uncharacterized protein n=1 Tax=Thelohanellus kitauei TaxID=669202 RepID=A0A0C2M1U9_THEKT|nr:hypothetical protein RF11_14768 [Thelohanellus kitauei]